MLPKMVPSFRNVGVGFFPVDDRSEFIMAIETPPGSNLEYTRLKTEQIAALTRAHKEVRYTYTTLGSSDRHAESARALLSAVVDDWPENAPDTPAVTAAREYLRRSGNAR